jgi:hypothetical protein
LRRRVGSGYWRKSRRSHLICLGGNNHAQRPQHESHAPKEYRPTPRPRRASGAEPPYQAEDLTNRPRFCVRVAHRMFAPVISRFSISLVPERVTRTNVRALSTC